MSYHFGILRPWPMRCHINLGAKITYLCTLSQNVQNPCNLHLAKSINDHPFQFFLFFNILFPTPLRSFWDPSDPWYLFLSWENCRKLEKKIADSQVQYWDLIFVILAVKLNFRGGLLSEIFLYLSRFRSYDHFYAHEFHSGSKVPIWGPNFDLISSKI